MWTSALLGITIATGFFGAINKLQRPFPKIFLFHISLLYLPVVLGGFLIGLYQITADHWLTDTIMINPLHGHKIITCSFTVHTFLGIVIVEPVASACVSFFDSQPNRTPWPDDSFFKHFIKHPNPHGLFITFPPRTLFFCPLFLPTHFWTPLVGWQLLWTHKFI